MKFHFPPIYDIDYKHVSGNRIYQLKSKSYSTVPSEILVHDVDGITGHKIRIQIGEVFLASNIKKEISGFRYVISFRNPESLQIEKLAKSKDWAKKQWIKHPDIQKRNNFSLAKKQAVIDSWDSAFNFNQELKNQEGEIIDVGLRSPQIGALYAILSHWAVSKDTATIVLPTGVGKTETMLSASIAYQCNNVLVIVPTDALRDQISQKFIELGLLKELGLLSKDAKYPIVGVLKKKFKSVVQARDFFEKCNVVVSTVNIVGQIDQKIQKEIARTCSYLFIDEAHHTEAATWKSFKQLFGETIAQFTATPFRNDGKEIDGKIIFEYTLRQAQNDGYYKEIEFHEVEEWIPNKIDESIAKKAVDLLEEDVIKKGLNHVLMARVLTIDRAEEVYQIYKNKYDRNDFNPVRIHTRMSQTERREAKEKILSGQSRIIICVDMLGEGFDLPQLKIAAFHDIRQSLPITIQIVGRFTRAQQNLGNAKIVANVADPNVSKELLELYSFGANWNSLLAQINLRIISRRDRLDDFFEGFEKDETNFSVQNLKPALSTVIYKTANDGWSPKNYQDGIQNISQYDKVTYSLHRSQKVLVIILGKKEKLIWADLKEVHNWRWDMIILYRDQINKLLYIHTTNTSSYHKKLAESVVGEVELVRGIEVFRCFHGINRLRLKNVGLREKLGRLVSFVMRFGSDVESGMSEAQIRDRMKVVIMGTGYESGEKVSVGCSLKGRIWYQRRNPIDTLIWWCDHIGSKVLNRNLDPDLILDGTLKTKLVYERPNLVPINMDWPDDFYFEGSTLSFKTSTGDFYLFECNLELDIHSEQGELDFSIKINEDTFKYRLNLLKNSEGLYQFKFEALNQSNLTVCIGRSEFTLEQYFDQNPPSIWFNDGSSLIGNIYIQLPDKPLPYSKEIETWDWENTNIKKESQGLLKEKDSIQRKVIKTLIKKSEYDIVFDDDASGEIADVITLKHSEDIIYIEFFHCKFSSKNESGGRIKDLYEVCGQAQKCIRWMDNPEEIIKHMIRREEKREDEGKVSRIDFGQKEFLINLGKISKSCEIKLNAVYIVQPGLSVNSVSTQQLELLAVTENYLMETRKVPFKVIASN